MNINLFVVFKLQPFYCGRRGGENNNKKPFPLPQLDQIFSHLEANINEMVLFLDDINIYN